MYAKNHSGVYKTVKVKLRQVIWKTKGRTKEKPGPYTINQIHINPYKVSTKTLTMDKIKSIPVSYMKHT